MLHSETLADRKFPGWSMGFPQHEPEGSQHVRAFFDLTRDALEQRLPAAVPGVVSTLFWTFYRTANWRTY
jgi:hypothetical protein